MSLEMFASQRSGIEQSMTSTIISSIIGQLTQQGSQNSLIGGNLGGGGGIQSALSNIGPLSPNHALVQRVQQDTGIQDPQQASHPIYATGRGLINEHSNNNPQGMQSLFSNFL